MRKCLVAGGFSALVCLTAAGQVFAQSDDAKTRIREFVSSCEFAPAISLAEKIADPAARDQIKSEIATAQYQSGAPTAATATMLGIGDGTLRQSAYSGMSQNIWEGAPAPNGRAG